MHQSLILTVNTGSASVKLAAFDVAEVRQVAAQHYTTSESTPEALLRAFIDELGEKEIAAVSHRIVHGGARFHRATKLDDETEHEIEELSYLAPLHNPRALRWIQAAREVVGAGVLQVGVFDTAFYADLPEAASTYALPHELRENHGIRRYGFHGLAHGAMNRRWRELRPELENGGRVISLQLGSGCSMTATKRGAAQDTSMGFSPLEGLVMATRPGDVDAGVLAFLQREQKLSVEEIETLLNHQSGLLGVSGISNDMRVLLASDEPRAKLAIELYCYRARKYLGAYLAVLGGADGVLFGGGVGENAAAVREKILSGLEWCGIELDRNANATASGEARISTQASKTEVRVVPVDEATTLAREAAALLQVL